jgi:hypothetical protein
MVEQVGEEVRLTPKHAEPQDPAKALMQRPFMGQAKGEEAGQT